jgi:hypothetical protein
VKIEQLDEDATPMILEATVGTYNDDDIIYADDIPVNEECFEISDSSEICLTFKDEPMDRLISPIPPYEFDNLKSPLPTISDCGYESIGSPVSSNDLPPSFTSLDDDWNNMIDLFPALA